MCEELSFGPNEKLLARSIDAANRIFRSSRGSQGALSPLGQQPSSQHVKVREGKHSESPHRVLVNASVAYLGKAPQTLDDVERMLAARTRSRAAAVDRALMLIELARVRGPSVHAVSNAGVFALQPVLFAPVALVTIELGLLAVQQLLHASDVGFVRRAGRDTVHHASPVGAHVQLHAEVPVLALPGLVHLRIALGFLVLGRAWRCDDRRIDDRARSEQQPSPLEQTANLGEDRLGQPVLLQQMPEAQDRGLVRDRVLGELDAGEAAHRLDVVERVFSLRIRQVEPLLHEVHPQHPLKPQRRPALACLRVVRFNERAQPCPRHHRIHLRKKSLSASRSTLGGPGHRGKRRLFHLVLPVFRADALFLQTRFTGTCSEFP